MVNGEKEITYKQLVEISCLIVNALPSDLRERVDFRVLKKRPYCFEHNSSLIKGNFLRFIKYTEESTDGEITKQAKKVIKIYRKNIDIYYKATPLLNEHPQF